MVSIAIVTNILKEICEAVKAVDTDKRPLRHLPKETVSANVMLGLMTIYFYIVLMLNSSGTRGNPDNKSNVCLCDQHTNPSSKYSRALWPSQDLSWHPG